MSPASELRIPDSRPRGLIGGGYVEELRRRASSTHEHEYARLLLWARNLPHRPEADFETPGFAEHGLFRVSLLYAMKRDRRFAESARRLARIILDRPPTSR